MRGRRWLGRRLVVVSPRIKAIRGARHDRGAAEMRARQRAMNTVRKPARRVILAASRHSCGPHMHGSLCFIAIYHR